MDENPSSSKNPCPTSQETRPNPIDDTKRFATTIFWKLKYDNNVDFSFVKFNKKHKEGSEHYIFYHGSSHSLRKCKEFKEFVQE